MCCCSACNALPHRGRGRRAEVDFLGRVYELVHRRRPLVGQLRHPEPADRAPAADARRDAGRHRDRIAHRADPGPYVARRERGGEPLEHRPRDPSFALLVLGAQLWGIGEIGGMSKAALLALIAVAIPPIIVNSYVGMSQVDEGIRDSAKGVGMRSSQRMFRVELPIALPLVMAGIRISARCRSLPPQRWRRSSRRVGSGASSSTASPCATSHGCSQARCSSPRSHSRSKARSLSGSASWCLTGCGPRARVASGSLVSRRRGRCSSSRPVRSPTERKPSDQVSEVAARRRDPDLLLDRRGMR